MSPQDDCEVVGQDYILIPEGEYEVLLQHWETSSQYSRKNKDEPRSLKGGKLYLWFQVDPYNNCLEGRCLVFLLLI